MAITYWQRLDWVTSKTIIALQPIVNVFLIVLGFIILISLSIPVLIIHLVEVYYDRRNNR